MRILRPVAFLALCLLAACAGKDPGRPGAGEGDRSAAIESVRLQPGQFPAGWETVDYFYASAPEVKAFGEKFGVEVRAVSNQVIEAAGTRLQINYIEAADPGETDKVFRALLDLVGASNSLAVSGPLVMELICADVRLTGQALELLNPERVHRHWE